MKEILKIREAVLQALRGAGITALEAYPAQWTRKYAGAAVTVDVGTVDGAVMGFCNYLGEVYDQTAGTVRELYGKQLEAEIWVDVYGGKATECQEGCCQTADVLLGGLPSGIRPGELSWEGLVWEKETALVRRRGRLRCRAFFVAEATEDADVFLDFQLKGVVHI